MVEEDPRYSHQILAYTKKNKRARTLVILFLYFHREIMEQLSYPQFEFLRMRAPGSLPFLPHFERFKVSLRAALHIAFVSQGRQPHVPPGRQEPRARGGLITLPGLLIRTLPVKLTAHLHAPGLLLSSLLEKKLVVRKLLSYQLRIDCSSASVPSLSSLLQPASDFTFFLFRHPHPFRVAQCDRLQTFPGVTPCQPLVSLPPFHLPLFAGDRVGSVVWLSLANRQKCL